MATPDVKRQRIVKDQDGPSDMEEDTVPTTSVRKDSVQELMRPYYARLFPHQQMYKWLVYGNDGKQPQADTGFFARREFCFTMDGDIFVRYQSFKDGGEMRDAINRRCPSKIDIGPVYTANPSDRLKFGAAFQPVERELVFDIDLTDYDDVRTCGKEGHICAKCWPLMAAAVKIIDRGLREDFGFSNILWVYSGRRGIHCWVCDPSARALTDEQRAAVASYFQVYKGHENDRAKLAMGVGAHMHPFVESAAEVLKEVWRETLLPAQALLEDEGMRSSMLKFLPADVAAAVEARWAKPAGKKVSEDVNLTRWDALVDEVERAEAGAKDIKARGVLQRVVTEIIFAFAYPRLDMEVSKKMNHLLKAPFCVHPKTGKVCVPLDPAAVDAFDPVDGVPTVHSLLAQLPPAQPGKEQAGEEWRTSELAPAVNFFTDHFLSGCARASKEVLANRARAAAAVPSLAF